MSQNLSDRWNTLGDNIDKAIKDKGPTGVLPYASLLNSTLNGFRAATEKTSRSFANDQKFAGFGGVSEMIGSLMPLAGILVKAGGPAAETLMGLIGGFFSILGAAITGFEPPRKSLRDEIDEALAELHVKLICDDLAAAKEEFTTGLEILGHMDDASRTWEQLLVNLNLVEGNAVHEINRSKSWLTENQSNPRWKDAFRAYWSVVALRTQYAGLMLSKLVTAADSLKLGLATNGLLLEVDRKFARDISSAARNAGTIWHVGDNRQIYRRTGLMSDSDWTSLDGTADRVLVSADDMVYGHDETDGIVWAGLPGNRFGGGSHKILDFCVLPQKLTNSRGGSSLPPMNDALFLLTAPGRSIRWELIFEHHKTREDGNHDIKRWHEIQLDVTATRILATPGGVAVMSNGRDTLNKVRLFLIVDGEVRSVNAVPSFPWRVQSPAVVLRPPAGEHFIGITADARYLYAHTKRQLFRAPLDRIDGGHVTRESVSVPPKLGDDIRSISASDDEQVLLVAGDDLWALYETTHVTWQKEDNAQARWAAKRGITGFDVCAGYMRAESIK